MYGVHAAEARGGEGDSEYVLTDGIFRPRVPVRHREDTYDERGFALLRQMQSRHFWYLGRRRFLWHALLDARYFMFLLSPLLVLGRLMGQPDVSKLSRDELWALVERSHRVPSPPVNALLRAAFSLETPLGHQVSFPWGTSVLAVLQKPEGSSP